METKEMKIPQHVAIILDGNGRWAKKRLLPRTAGHVQGSKTVEKICKVATELGIKYMTVYAFSTENWSRPKEEVDVLMNLLGNYLNDCINNCKKNNMIVKIIGDITPLRDDLKERIKKLEEDSAVNTGLYLQVAINYGGRDEIIRGVRNMMKDYGENKLSLDELDEKKFASYLDTKGIPDPDLMIRTSGEQRLSNYLLWQLAYTEFYFTDVLWPDFDRKELEKAIEYYNGRDRRFGGVKA